MYKIFIATILVVLHSISMAKSDDILYDCPYINDVSRQTLGQIYQGYDGWFFKDVDFKKNYILSPKTVSFINRFNKALAHHNIELIFLPLVSKSIIGYGKITQYDIHDLDYNHDAVVKSYNDFINQLKNIDVTAPNLLSKIKNYNQNNLDDLVFKIDHHWTPEGSRQTAQVIANIIKNNENYADYPKIKITYKKLKDPLNMPSNMRAEVQNLCTDKIPNEKLNIYDFEILSEKNENALFGDGHQAPIALIGTSFSSVNNFKFRNFIEYETKLKTVNYSIPGGELYTSIISYLSSEFFENEKPKYIIWESPSKYNYNNLTGPHFRQMIPAIYGDCLGDKVMAENKIVLSSSKTGILFKELKRKKITGNQYYLRIETSNPIFNKFTLDIEYEDGDGEWFNMDQSNRYRNNKVFYIELSDDIESHLSSIVIENTAMIGTQLNAKICNKTTKGNL